MLAKNGQSQPRFFNFDHWQIDAPAAEPFKRCLQAFVGVAGPDDAPLLSSYWCELCFNDCRDADANLQFNQKKTYHLFCLIMILRVHP